MENLRGNFQVFEKDKKRIIQEYFPSIHLMLECLDSRKNNNVMRDEHSSTEKGSGEWTGTRSYEEATDLIVKGYVDILDKLTLGINQAIKSIKDSTITKSQLIEDVQGATPIVPNYILGLPNTMSYRQPTVKKIKTINILYSPTENCGSEKDDFIDAGVAILSAIRAIEKGHISIKLDCLFCDCDVLGESVFGIVRLKDYKDRLDLQKLCFPLAHPSMLRRFGFKFLETVPELSDTDFRDGYGSTPDLEKLEKYLSVPNNTVILNLRLVKYKLNNDPIKVIKYINDKLSNGKK